MTDCHELVNDYARLAARWWDRRIAPHGMTCPCLPCADHRAAIYLEPLNVSLPVMAAPASRRAALVGG